jgi:hypothetical protein
MAFLAAAEIIGNLGLQICIDLIHVVHHQDVFGGDGAIGFELKTPMAIRVLKSKQGVPGSPDRSAGLFLEERSVVLLDDGYPFYDRFHNPLESGREEFNPYRITLFRAPVQP